MRGRGHRPSPARSARSRSPPSPPFPISYACPYRTCWRGMRVREPKSSFQDNFWGLPDRAPRVRRDRAPSARRCRRTSALRPHRERRPQPPHRARLSLGLRSPPPSLPFPIRLPLPYPRPPRPRRAAGGASHGRRASAYGVRDAACPLSTRGGTRLVQAVRGRAGGGEARLFRRSGRAATRRARAGGARAPRGSPRPTRSS
jgi:hypothetical protein